MSLGSRAGQTGPGAVCWVTMTTTRHHPTWAQNHQFKPESPSAVQRADVIVCDVTLRGIPAKQTRVVIFVGSSAPILHTCSSSGWCGPIQAAQPTTRNYRSMLSNIPTCSKHVIWMISRGGKNTCVPAELQALESCAVRSSMCASHLGRALAAISTSAEAPPPPCPGPAARLEASWRFSWSLLTCSFRPLACCWSVTSALRP